MSTLFDRFIMSAEPAEPLQHAARDVPELRRFSSHLFSSLFSTHVGRHPTDWATSVADAALALLSDDTLLRPELDWLLEISLHASLALSETDKFHANLVQLDQALTDLEKNNGVSRSSQYVRGLLAFHQDDLKGAERAFYTLPNLADTLLSHQAGYAAFRAPDFYDTLVNYKPNIRLEYASRSKASGGDSILLLCSADAAYFVAFADEFAERVLEVSPTAQIHFHIVNPPHSHWMRDQELLRHDRISATAEQTGLPRPGIYAAMARFIVLPALLRSRHSPVLVTDIDLLIRNDPAQLSGDAPVKLGFSHNPAARHVPYTTILAGHTLFLPSQGGCEFAELISRYLHYMCVNHRGLRGADQIALLIVWYMLRDQIPIEDIHNCSWYKYGPSPNRPIRKRTAAEQVEREQTG